MYTSDEASELIMKLANFSRTDCGCSMSDVDVDFRAHRQGCLVGTAQRLVGMKVSFARGGPKQVQRLKWEDEK